MPVISRVNSFLTSTEAKTKNRSKAANMANRLNQGRRPFEAKDALRKVLPQARREMKRFKGVKVEPNSIAKPKERITKLNTPSQILINRARLNRADRYAKQ